MPEVDVVGKLLCETMADLAVQNRRLLSTMLADEERATAHRATIESIRHGGLKILLRLANDPEKHLGMSLEAAVDRGLDNLATALMERCDETDAAGVLNEWVGR